MESRAMRAWVSFGFATIGLAALSAAPAGAQNAMGQIMTPFSTNTLPPAFTGTGPGDGHHGDHDGHFRHNVFPVYVFPYSPQFMDDGGTGSVQFNPVNPGPFAPAAPPTASDRTPAAPYKPPSVEIAPGGIEIVRGPG